MESEIVAPAGWGHVPGMPLGDITAATLPELPMLRFFSVRRRTQVIADALRALPYLDRITAAMVAERYGIPNGTAYNAVLAARTGMSRRAISKEAA